MLAGLSQREHEHEASVCKEYTDAPWMPSYSYGLFKKKAFYEMVEVSLRYLLAKVADVPRALSSLQTARLLESLLVQDPPDFTLKLDRSDAKITLANINKLVCSVLGTWQLDPRV